MRWFIALLVLTLVFTSVLARRRGGRGRGRGQSSQGGCKYNHRARTVGECDPDTNKKNLTIPVKAGSDPSCTPKTKEIPCKGNMRCKYDHKARSESECDPNTNTKTLTIPVRAGSDSGCTPKTKQISCLNCKYNWKGKTLSECDTTTNRKTLTIPLAEGSDPNCTAKTKDVPCQRKCKYDWKNKVVRGCDGTSNENAFPQRKTVTAHLIEAESDTSCSVTLTKEFPCRMQRKGKKHALRRGIAHEKIMN